MVMAIKYFCDACDREILSGSGSTWRYCRHIESPGKFGYIDKEGNEVSGSTGQKILCARCYNRILGSAWREFGMVQKEQKE